MHFLIYFVKKMIHLLFTLKRIKFIINILSGLPSIKLFQCGVPFCSVFNLNNKNVNALVARELSGFTCTRSLKMNEKFQCRTRWARAVLKLIVHC